MTKRRSRISRGIIYSIIASLFFSMMNALAKHVSAVLPAGEIVLFRSIVSFICISVWMLLRGHSFRANNYPLLFTRGILGGLGLIGFFYAISKIKLGDSGILIQLIPIFVVPLAAIFLHERMPKRFFMFLMLALIGSFCVIKPSPSNLATFPALIGVLSALLAASAYICVKILTRTNNTYIIILYFIACSGILGGALACENFILPPPSLFLSILLLGIAAALGQIFMTSAYSIEKASIVSVAGYVGLVFHILIGFIFWGEMLDPLSIIGALCILCACLGLARLGTRIRIDDQP